MGLAWGGPATGPGMGPGHGGPAMYPSPEPRAELWDARTLALHAMLRDLALHSPDPNVRLCACVAMLDRLCGKPKPMAVTEAAHGELGVHPIEPEPRSA